MADHHYTDADDVIDATHLGWGDRIYAGAGNDTVKLGPLVAYMSEAVTATADAIPCRASAPYMWGRWGHGNR